MKIIATVAEYNPFHLGHVKHIDYMKNTLKADRLIVVMSGNFTQRGEPAVLDKFTRAKHAVIAGADLVIELPTVFAVSNAEIFAKGACGIINSLGVADSLCFGVESGLKEDYLSLAAAMNDESRDFKRVLKDCLSDGVSLAKAKFLALKLLGKSFDEALIGSPNNILALEYTKSLLSLKSDIQIEPMKRDGDHNDIKLKKGITSASSIREVIRLNKLRRLKKNLPPYVYGDLKIFPEVFDKMVMSALYTSSASELGEIYDCTEGLENRIKAFSKDNYDVQSLVEKVSTKRYTKARIRRILIDNLLGVKRALVDASLSGGLYAKVLAVNSECKDVISLVAKHSSIPVLTRKSDLAELNRRATAAFEKDVLANDLYNMATGSRTNENGMIMI